LINYVSEQISFGNKLVIAFAAVIRKQTSIEIKDDKSLF